MLDATRHHNPLIGLIDATSRIRGRLKSAFAQSTENCGLTEMEMTVLNAVTEAKSAPTVPQIGRALGHPRQVIQRATNTLIENGMIAAQDNPDHKRAMLLITTDKGLALKREVNAIANQIEAELLRSIDAALVIETTTKLETLRAQLDAHFRKTPKGIAHD
jgi:DNA-binding MarR family transcriptional regulator